MSKRIRGLLIALPILALMLWHFVTWRFFHPVPLPQYILAVVICLAVMLILRRTLPRGGAK